MSEKTSPETILIKMRSASRSESVLQKIRDIISRGDIEHIMLPVGISQCLKIGEAVLESDLRLAIMR